MSRPARERVGTMPETTLQRELLAELREHEARTGRPYALREMLPETYRDAYYAALRALEADGTVRIVHDAAGSSYASTARAAVGFGREVHGLPLEVQGSTAYALACETGPREAICADVEATGDASYLARVWLADATYARVAASRESFREVPSYRRHAGHKSCRNRGDRACYMGA
jgi:hypothetical protein